MKEECYGKHELQEAEYRFPYHHITHFDDDGIPIVFRKSSYEYVCYMNTVTDLILSLEPSSVLDVGCGDGRLCGFLDGRIERYVGVDPSKRAIDFAKAFYPHAEFYASEADALGETFDVVVAVETLEHIPGPEICDFLSTLHSRVSKGGHVIISVPTVVIPMIDKHFRHYTLDMLQQQLNDCGVSLSMVSSQYVYRESPLNLLLSALSRLSELRLLRRGIWKAVMDQSRKATKKDGRHLIVVLRRDY